MRLVTNHIRATCNAAGLEVLATGLGHYAGKPVEGLTTILAMRDSTKGRREFVTIRHDTEKGLHSCAAFRCVLQATDDFRLFSGLL